jgi:hypothetical protein
LDKRPSFVVKLNIESASILKTPFPIDPTQIWKDESSVIGPNVKIPLFELKGVLKTFLSLMHTSILL